MELNKSKLALATTITMAITYLICGLFTALWPDVALKFLGWMIHLVNIEKFAGGVNVTLGNFILGLLPILFYTYLGTYLFAWLYNKLIRPKI